MRCFLLVPEWLTLRSDATNALDSAGYALLSHYTTVLVSRAS